MKELVAQEIASRVRDGDLIGVGTGSTVDCALEAIGKRVVGEGLSIKVVPTSYQSAWRCQELGLEVLYTGFCGRLSWGFDGADQVTSQRWAIKGKGGALLQEKILAKRCDAFVVIVDESKLVRTLGSGCPIPVEVVPEARILAEEGLRNLGAQQVGLRTGSGKHGPVITERGNILLDAEFSSIDGSLENNIRQLVGVVESGLFSDCITELLVATSAGITTF
jgi:ribose 5-phosphate isomerase A